MADTRSGGSALARILAGVLALMGAAVVIAFLARLLAPREIVLPQDPEPPYIPPQAAMGDRVSVEARPLRPAEG